MIGLLLSLVAPLTAQEATPEPTPQSVGLRPDAPTYALHGPYWVGTREMEVPGQSGKSALKLTLWYPALNPNNLEEKITYTPVLKYDPAFDTTAVFYGHALLNAAPNISGGPYPLVAFSHGFASSPTYYSYLLEHLASYGFVILAPDHLETSYLDDDQWRDLAPTSINRPQDMVRVLDYAETLTSSSGALSGLIDMNQVAVVGHSYGGYTALALAGARYDLNAFNARCAALAADDPHQILCSPLVPKEQDMAKLAGLSSLPDGLWPSWATRGSKPLSRWLGTPTCLTKLDWHPSRFR